MRKTSIGMLVFLAIASVGICIRFMQDGEEQHRAPLIRDPASAERSTSPVATPVDVSGPSSPAERIPLETAGRDPTDPASASDPRLEIAWELTGRVMLEESRIPIADAMVRLVTNSFPPGVLGEARTDASGRFRIVNPKPPDALVFEVFAPGRVPFAHTIAPEQARHSRVGSIESYEVEILAPEGHMLRLRILDATTRTPLAGARASQVSGELGVSNAEGTIEIRGVRAGGFECVVKAEGYCSSRIGIPAGRRVEELSIPMLRACAIVGRVVDDAGDPVVGAAVYGGRRDGEPNSIQEWLTEPLPEFVRVSPARLECVSRADGSYALSGLIPSPEPFLLCVRSNPEVVDRGRKVAELVLDRPGVELFHEIRFGATNVGLIQGVVFGNRKQVSARLILERSGFRREIETSADRDFEIADVETGEYTLRAEWDGVVSQKRVSMTPDAIRYVAFQLRSREPIVSSGRVVAESNFGLGIARLSASTGDSREAVPLYADGRFQHEWFGDPGAVIVFEYRDPFQTVSTQPVSVGTQGVEIPVRAIDSVPGNCETERGTRPVSLRCEWRESLQGEFRAAGSRDIVVQEGGEFRFAAPHGSIDLRFADARDPTRVTELIGVRIPLEHEPLVVRWR